MADVSLHKRSESFSSLAFVCNVFLVLGAVLMTILGFFALCMVLKCPPTEVVYLGR
jgi:hypothetical protein